MKKRWLDPGGSKGSGVDATEVAGDNCAEEIQGLWPALAGDNPAAQLSAARQLRRLLSAQGDVSAAIQEVVDIGAVPRLVQFLRETSQPELQSEAAWALANVASGTEEQTRAVVKHGALPTFVELLRADAIRERAAWALGNIGCDARNLYLDPDPVVSGGLLSSLAAVLGETEDPSLLRTATWALKNWCKDDRSRRIPYPRDELLQVHAVLASLIRGSDIEVLADACSALAVLVDGPNDRIDAAIQAGVCPRLAELLQHASPSVWEPALRAIGNIVTGDDLQTDVVLRSGALPSLLALLERAERRVQKEVCWTVSSITAGNRNQIQAVIEAGLIPPIVDLLQCPDLNVRKEAMWAVCNCSSGGSEQHLEYLVNNGVVERLTDHLTDDDVKIVSLALEGLEQILDFGKGRQIDDHLDDNPIATQIEEADGREAIEQLRDHPNEEVYEKAQRVLNTRFDAQDEAPKVIVTIGLSGNGQGVVATTLNGKTLTIDGNTVDGGTETIIFRQLKQRVADALGCKATLLRFVTATGQVVGRGRDELDKKVAEVLQSGS